MKSKKLKIIFITITILLIILIVVVNVYKTKSESITEKSSTVSDIIYNDKVNIYLFWGKGCPHCKEEIKFLNSIYKDYSQYFNTYTFEVWYDESNASLMQEFAKELNETPKGVPYLIIGNKSFIGFSSGMEDSIKNEIINQYNNKTSDVYQEITQK